MDGYASELKEQYTAELGAVSLEYMTAGIDIFHRHLTNESDVWRSAVGMLSAGCEMAIKTFIARHNLAAIFRGLPADLQLFLTNPEAVPTFFEWRSVGPELRAGKYDTISIRECVDAFYLFFPQDKQLLMPHISYLLRWGGAAFHTVLPPLDRYGFERTGYAVLHIADTLSKSAPKSTCFYMPTTHDRRFMESFHTRRVERVRLAVQKAGNAEVDENTPVDLPPFGWDAYVTECPVCGSKGVAQGYTQLAVSSDGNSSPHGLDFFPVSFSCGACGLRLNDLEEMKLGSLPILFDRSDDLERWLEEHHK